VTAKRRRTGLAAALAALKTPAAAEGFLKEMLTPRELRDLMLRWELLALLADGLPQRGIAERLGVSLCKITRGAKILKSKKSIVAKFLK
jgi:TrpR family trp operon transcriptional repressor